MIIGTVQTDGDAVVSLRLRGASGRVASLRVVVDTGFNDFLTLPRVQIEAVGLSFREEVRCMLADGSEAVNRVFVAQVEWLGNWIAVLVLEIENDPLPGMALLRGHFLGMEVTDGGAIEVRPLV